MPNLLSGHIALVTGGTRGIGRACALLLAQEGAAVAIGGSRPSPAAEQTLQELKHLGVPALFLVADVSKKSETFGMFAAIKDTLGPVDILVNNAAVFDPQYTNGWSLSEEKWDWMLDVNLKGVYLCCAAAIPGMLAKGWGRIINISSSAGISGGTSGIHYAASKGGIIALTKAFARELALKNITVNSVAPAKVETEMLTASIKPGETAKVMAGIPVGRFGKPEEVAEAVFYFANPNSAFTTAQVLSVSGGY
jgi:3-oxoacyl-[acyl-carrier protein] reductase